MTLSQQPEPLLPLGLRLRGRRVVVVGGGPVALRRVGALTAALASVTVIAPEAVAALEDLAERGRISWCQRPYEPGDLDGAWLAMACTADAEVNAQVLAAADEARIFCLRADDASAASAWMPATGRTGRATVSVHGDRDPRTAAALRDVALAAVGAALREDSGLRSGRRPRLVDTGPSTGSGTDQLNSGADQANSGPDQAKSKVTGMGSGERSGMGSGMGAGRVTLVGGGPGDPGLLTLRGSAALADADVVVVDRLAPLAVLDTLRDGVEIVDVSKIPRGRFTPQEKINEILVSRARAGLVVVRLKGGDPFVFGRGMEEVIACAEAGVAVEIVPGVSSATAVPGLAGIPLTHRGVFYSSLPDTITIYQKPIERVAGEDEERIREQVRHTVVHEIAHYYGITDERLDELGRY